MENKKFKSQDLNILTPSELKVPVFLMNFPLTLSNRDLNNIWMEEIPENKLQINYEKAFSQFINVYNYFASNSIVYLLPNYGNFQDQVYVANLAVYLPHLENTIILSNFKSEPRRGEEEVGKEFFKLMKYKTFKPDLFFEGEAELKWLEDNIYVGGYGIRSDNKVYDWMEKKFDMKIIRIPTDDYLYHLDCKIFLITKDKVLVYVNGVPKKAIKQIEKYKEIIPIGDIEAFSGITNSVRVRNSICCASHINLLTGKDKDYSDEKVKVDLLTNICAKEGLEPIFFNLFEYMKSGALLSCMVMHLNYVDYKFNLV